ncbi:heterogeneous nuclear ribonucleoproteins A2/B1-like isoform X2 [Anopheles arabiensis]|uniref:heterogeneous nuclear ribonucleoproteins A2/B1-like isoform X2 n=1 Tax=Anopheles arabiensis TaxID=7173 RepID=UPI001AAD6525|nr:heterogeneous nuclear ribonucleoproteins A2/B1-like isoform X2 [Anopheles arabiensis]XP_040161379.1 heterogeneous nuclear ribonucleoproteins A2/B1-like isoform X2 [Anopheles arabiensis]XP_040161380.1 heterogeneous nuclear ribonucleoproteins A2/B1-like isoform X2 [Anopheles arabiensis]XP_040161381.1 heterogeneous nuclear ribonucleoproteins A2/B1-like isoform X2 [Anopheles arabiensis]XP_040161382.1 heterogeneous nuclear ribonucleoproteins A2/B1-like isoform X2 [Anopheles arabiensis]XP_0401613
MLQSLLRLLTIFAVILTVTAQERWSWSGGGNNDNRNNAKNDADRYNVRSDVLEFQGTGSQAAASNEKRNTLAVRKGRYEVKETTTKRPSFSRPQNDEFSGEFGDGNQSNDFGFNQKFGGGGLINGQFGPNPYGINLGQQGGVGGFPFQGGNALGGAGFYPGQPHLGGGYGGLGHGSSGNGILVGPGGPTGIIGRPYNRFPYGGAGYYPGGTDIPMEEDSEIRHSMDIRVDSYRPVAIPREAIFLSHSV